MTATPAPGPAPRRKSLTVRIGRALRAYFFAGLVTLLPIALTAYLVVTIFRFADGLLGRHLRAQVPGLGLVLTILIIFVVGVLSVHLLGRLVIAPLEVWLIRLPLVNKIYPAAKQLAQFLFGERKPEQAFRRAVLVAYPRPGSLTIAFVTAETQTTVTGESQKLLTLLIPQPPSPFTGPIIFVPEQDVIPLDMPIEDAVKLIVSGGVVASPLRRRQQASSPS